MYKPNDLAPAQVLYDHLPMQIDRIDAQILLALDGDPRRSVVSLSEDLGLDRRTVQAHLARLEEGGVLRAHSTRLLPERLGYTISAVISADLDQSQLHLVVATLEQMPEVLEVSATSGDQDVLARVVAVDTDHLYLLGQQILRCAGVRRTRTTLVLRDLIPYRTRPLIDARRSTTHSSSETVVDHRRPR
jgi:DNA-binding Lrp family transcriptional regulator